ncbi:lectin subunit alpha-like [Cochliomyia hominivorax]
MRPMLISCCILTFFLIFKFKAVSANGRMYTSNAGNKYYIETEQKFSWTEALIKCMELDMTLMSVDTEEKANEIDQIFKKEFGKTIYVWIGGIRSRYPRDHFVWFSTGKEFNYTHWEKNNPNFQRENQFCVEIGYDNMEWNDLTCYTQIGFICEMAETKQQLYKEIENLRTKLKQQNRKGDELEIEKIVLKKELNNLKMTVKQQEKHVKDLIGDEQFEKTQETLPERKYGDIIFNFYQNGNRNR